MKSKDNTKKSTLYSVAMRLSALSYEQGKISSSRNFKAAALALDKYGFGQKTLSEIGSTNMEQLQNAMCAHGLSANTSAGYMRKLRRAYRVAVAEGLVPDNRPFDSVSTATTETVKRALLPEHMTRIRLLSLEDNPRLEYARDLFLFLYYCQGMSFVDMAHLKKEDVCRDSLTYRRQKTGQLIYTHLSPQAKAIITHYSDPKSPYLLPIISNQDDPTVGRRQYETAHRSLNRRLKVIGAMANLDIPLTTYVARHTWASIAHAKDIAISVISASLGHTSERTTRIYLAALNHSSIELAALTVANAI